jgi:hypothetical protein
MPDQGQTLLVAIALIGVVGFLVWLVFFTGEGYQGVLQDLKSVRKVKQERFPVPVFDRSKIELPRPKKPTPRNLERSNEVSGAEQLAIWAEELRKSIEEIREEANALAKAYKELPPQFAELATKPPKRAITAKPTSKKTTSAKKQVKPVKKTAKTKAKKTNQTPARKPRKVSK